MGHKYAVSKTANLVARPTIFSQAQTVDGLESLAEYSSRLGR